MKFAARLLFIATLVGLGGCLPVSQNPLSPPDTAAADKRLAGVWYGKSGEDTVFLHFVAGPAAMMDVVEVDHQKDGNAHTDLYTVFPSVINGAHYLNVQEKKGTNKSYHLARYQISDSGTLTIWLMSEKPVVKAIDAEKIPGKVSRKDSSKQLDTRDVTITASTEHLAAFVSKSDPEVLFADKFCTFKKLNLPAVEASSTPTPKSSPKSGKPHKKKTNG